MLLELVAQCSDQFNLAKAIVIILTQISRQLYSIYIYCFNMKHAFQIVKVD